MGRRAPPPRQLIVDEIADQPRVAAELRRSVPRGRVRGHGKPRIERIRHSPPPELALQPERHGVGQAMHGPQIRLAPIANGVEPPGFEPLHRLLAPALAPIRAEFALEVSGVKVEGATMIERAAGLRPQSATVVVLAPMCGKLSIRRRQIAEHRRATVDIGFPSERNHVHPDREEAIALGGDEPPSPVTLLSTEEARRAKTANLRKPTEAV